MITRTTGRAMLDFWKSAPGRGFAGRLVSREFIGASAHVFEALGRDPEDVDVMTLNIDDAVTQFQRANTGVFTPLTLDAYARRFRRAVEYFRHYVRNPGESPMTPAATTIHYTFPVRVGVTAHLVLPTDLRASEARRLAAFLSSLVREEGDRGSV